MTSNDTLFCLDAATGKTNRTEDLKGRGGRQQGCVNVVDAGPALVALTPLGQLVVFEPAAKGYKVLARYPAAAGANTPARC